MQKKDIIIGGKYLAKVSGKIVIVRVISRSNTGTGYNIVNLSTGRAIKLRSGARLRPYEPELTNNVTVHRVSSSDRKISIRLS